MDSGELGCKFLLFPLTLVYTLPSLTQTLHLLLCIILGLSAFMCNVCCVKAPFCFYLSRFLSVLLIPYFRALGGTLCIQGPQRDQSWDIMWAFGRRDATEGRRLVTF